MVKKNLFFVGFFMMMSHVMAAPLQDPTQPTGPGVTTPAVADVLGKNIVVNAIYFSTQRYVAIINGTLVGQGDIIAGYRIVGIQPYAVKFRGPEGVFVKRIVSPRVKYPVIQQGKMQ